MPTTTDVLDYRVIAEPVRSLWIATDNKLDRESHPRLDVVPGARRLVHSMFKVTANAFQAVMFLCADSDADPARRPELAVAAPPLLRVLADSLFTLVFLFDDLPTNVRWYWTAGWHEAHCRYAQWERRHGNDPDWTDLLAGQRQLIEREREHWGIAGEEQARRKVNHWPNPGRMPRATRCPTRKDFLEYLKAWFYGPLSSSTHLSAPGLTTSAAFLLARDRLDDYEHRLNKYKSDQTFIALTLLFAIVSELEVELHLGLAERLGFLWVIVSKYAWGTDDLYTKRYQSLLGFPGQMAPEPPPLDGSSSF